MVSVVIDELADSFVVVGGWVWTDNAVPDDREVEVPVLLSILLNQSSCYVFTEAAKRYSPCGSNIPH